MKNPIFPKGGKVMYNKKEMFLAVVLSLTAGFAVGYSKARELCLQSIMSVTGTKSNDSNEE